MNVVAFRQTLVKLKIKETIVVLAASVILSYFIHLIPLFTGYPAGKRLWMMFYAPLIALIFFRLNVARRNSRNRPEGNTKLHHNPTVRARIIVIAIAISLLFAIKAEAAISAPTKILDETSTTSAGSYTTASFTPSANVLLIVVTANTKNSNHDLTASVSDSLGSSFTQIQHLDTDTSYDAYLTLAYMQTGASPASRTVTVTPADRFWVTWIVKIYEVTGYNTSAPIKNTKTGEGSGGTTHSITLDSTPDSDSMVFGVISVRGDDDQAITQGTDFTLLDNSNAGTSDDGSLTQQEQYDLNNATTTVDWSGLTDPFGPYLSIGVEIDAAVAAGGRIMRTTIY